MCWQDCPSSWPDPASAPKVVCAPTPTFKPTLPSSMPGPPNPGWLATLACSRRHRRPSTADQPSHEGVRSRFRESAWPGRACCTASTIRWASTQYHHARASRAGLTTITIRRRLHLVHHTPGRHPTRRNGICRSFHTTRVLRLAALMRSRGMRHGCNADRVPSTEIRQAPLVEELSVGWKQEGREGDPDFRADDGAMRCSRGAPP